MDEDRFGAGETAPHEKIRKILERLLEGFEHLEECLASFFACWQKSLDELASRSKEGVAPAYDGWTSDSTDSSEHSVSGCPRMAQAEGVGDSAFLFFNLSDSLPVELGEEQQLHRLAKRHLVAAAGPESSNGNFLIIYLVEQLERLQHQQDQLQAQCNQLAIRLAEKTQQAAQLSDLFEQHKRQHLQSQQQWLHHLQLLKPFLDSAISHLIEFASVGDNNSLRAEELGDSSLGQSHQILSLPTFRERKSSIG